MIKIYDSIFQINKIDWDNLNKDHNPFTSYDFFKALESSRSIGQKSGWIPKYFVSDNSIAFIFIKYHSYGEYTFDWQWADAYQRNGLDYYPKIVSMSPFSPVSTNHFLGDQSPQLLFAIEEFFNSNSLSSIHFLYLSNKEKQILTDKGFILRTNIQYHFFNKNYMSFEDFLSKLKPKKKKQILKERLFSPEITIRQYTNQELTQDMAKRMFHFYISTIKSKRSIPYLNENFFLEVFKNLKAQILYIEAYNNNSPIAGSLYFYSQSKLFGRYWGSTQDVKNLHFELCYYQGIDFCITKGISVFEAGAQGEHKIKRGFVPTLIYSSHKIKENVFHTAIFRYITEESKRNILTVNELKQHLPFKEGI